jgi:hypothetical protein
MTVFPESETGSEFLYINASSFAFADSDEVKRELILRNGSIQE